MKEFVRRNKLLLTLMALCAAGITVTTVVFKQSWLRVGPMYVSLVISVMQARAIRYAPLLGGLNVIWHGFVALHYGLTANAMSCFFFSCPLQLITFLRWQKHKYGVSTVFRKLSWLWRIAVAVLFTAAFFGVVLILKKIGSSHTELDTLSTLLGILVSILALLSFIEFAPLQVVSCLIGIALTVMVIRDHIEYTPTLIYNVYSTLCVTMGTVSVFRLYREQKARKRVSEIQDQATLKTTGKEGENDENSMG